MCAAAEESSGKRARQPAGDEIGDDLSVEYGAVVLHAKEPEAGGQKEGIAGKTSQGGAENERAGWAGCGDAVDSVL